MRLSAPLTLFASLATILASNHNRKLVEQAGQFALLIAAAPVATAGALTPQRRATSWLDELAQTAKTDRACSTSTETALKGATVDLIEERYSAAYRSTLHVLDDHSERPASALFV
jgi:hypothetical protein